MSKRKKNKRYKVELTESEEIVWNKGDPVEGEVTKVYYYRGRKTLTPGFKAFFGHSPEAGGWKNLYGGVDQYAVASSNVGYMFPHEEENKLTVIWANVEVEILADYLLVKLYRYDPNNLPNDAPI